MSDLFVSNKHDPKAATLFTLLEARHRLADHFETWTEANEIGPDDDRAPIAVAFNSLDRSILELGGPSIERVHEIMHSVLGDVPGTIEDEPSVASAILRHCSNIVLEGH